MIAWLLLALTFTLPDSLDQRDAEIVEIINQRQVEFLDACYQWQDPARCDRVLLRTRFTICSLLTAL